MNVYDTVVYVQMGYATDIYYHILSFNIAIVYYGYTIIYYHENFSACGVAHNTGAGHQSPN